jgi:hypothetical protein
MYKTHNSTDVICFVSMFGPVVPEGQGSTFNVQHSTFNVFNTQGPGAQARPNVHAFKIPLSTFPAFSAFVHINLVRIRWLFQSAVTRVHHPFRYRRILYRSYHVSIPLLIPSTLNFEPHTSYLHFHLEKHKPDARQRGRSRMRMRSTCCQVKPETCAGVDCGGVSAGAYRENGDSEAESVVVGGCNAASCSFPMLIESFCRAK